MKYTIEGFNQAKSVELGLCVADLIILRWFVDFAGTDKIVKRIINDKEYYWIKYEGLLEDLPILSITKDTLYRRLKGLEPLVKKEDNPESTEAPKAEETEKDGGVKDYGF